jgi:hypothetical protein
VAVANTHKIPVVCRVANECIKQSITIIPLHYTNKTTLKCIQIIHERRTLTFVIQWLLSKIQPVDVVGKFDQSPEKQGFISKFLKL